MKEPRPRWHCLGIKPEFVPKIINGEKTTTIRATAPNMRAGNVINFFTGRRTKDYKYAISATILDVFDVHIQKDKVILNGHELSDTESLNAFAENDGFNYFGEMVAFFEKMYGKKSVSIYGKINFIQPIIPKPAQNAIKTLFD